MTSVHRLICDENIPAGAIQALRDRGHDVVAIRESAHGASDSTILARAQIESRIVITQDKDFGELAFRAGLPARCGIILFRLCGDNPQDRIRRMCEAIETRIEWSGHLTLVTDDTVRARPLP